MFLIVRAAGRRCALAVADVVETMRPLPVQDVGGAPSFVRGLAMIRGAPTPVVDLASWLGVTSAGPARWVAVRAGGRPVALAVDAVVGIRALDDARLQEAPPLLREATAERVELLGALDADLLIVLRTARVVPDEVWAHPNRKESVS